MAKRKASSPKTPEKKSKVNNANVTDKRKLKLLCYKALHENVNSMQLMDLHTHLIGMGNADFWVSRIMETYLINCHFLKESGASRTTEVYELMKCELTKQNFEQCKNDFDNNLKEGRILVIENTKDGEVERYVTDAEFWNLFTADVVYGEKSLFESFEISRGSEIIDRELTLNAIFSNAASELSMTMNQVFTEHIVFNARKGKFFHIKCGITNAKLVELMNAPNSAGKSIRALVRNAFSMLNSDGSHIRDPAGNISVEAKYRNQFTPEFDRRFILRDCIYEQRLEVLSILLNVVCSRYAKAGVKYVEFSLGFNDCMNENVWKHLADQVFTEGDREEKLFKKRSEYENDEEVDRNAFDRRRSSNRKSLDRDGEDTVQIPNLERESSPFWRGNFGEYRNRYKGFKYRFLAAFSRSKITYDGNDFHKTEDIYQYVVKNHDKLKELDIDDNALQRMFPKVFEQLQNLAQVLEKDSPLRKRFLFWVVGFDWVGNEKGSPFCPFTHSKFSQVLETIRSFGHHKKFGLRIHCGENVPRLNHIPIFKSHMDIVKKTLEKLVTKLKNMSDFQLLRKGSLTFPGLRIGHGVAFLDPSLAQFLEKTMKDEKIVCEINMTSNSYLLSHFYHGHRESERTNVVRKFLEAEVPIILSTDDDGIWSIPKCKAHYHHVSLAREFCEAVRTEAIISSKELKQIIKWTHCSIFNQIKEKK